MSEQVEAFARKVAEGHRPSSQPYWDAAVPGLFLVHCPACDGSQRQIWKPGDEEVTCALWQEALALGLVTA